MDTNQNPLANPMFVIKRADGTTVQPVQGADGSYRFLDVDTKLIFEFVARDMKRRMFATEVDPDARHVYVEITLNPITGSVKNVKKKYTYPKQGKQHKLRRAPAGWGGGPQTVVVPPDNDTCAGATEVPCDGTITVVDNTEATTDLDDPALSCHFSGPDSQAVGSIWFTFVATTGTVEIDTNESANQASGSDDTLIGLYDGTCGAFTEIACSEDEGDDLLSMLTYSGLTVGNTYYIQTGTFGDADRGEIALRVNCTGGVAMGGADLCSEATVIPCDGSVTVGDNTNATTDVDDPGLSCHFDGAGTQVTGSLWYQFVATSDTVQVDTNETGTQPNGSNDTLLALYDGSCGAFTELACSDDEGDALLSMVAYVGLTVGNTYYIQVGTYNDAARGEIAVRADCSSIGAGGNDNCADAAEVPCDGSVTVVDNTDFTTAPDDPPFSCHFSGPDVQGVGTAWFSFVATENAVEIDTNDSALQGNPSTDTLLALYDGSCGSFTELACSEDEGDGLLSMLAYNGLTVGNTYYVQTASFGDASRGDIAVRVNCLAVMGPPNDTCAGALPFECNTTELVDNSTASTDPSDPAFSCYFGGAAQGFGTVWYTFVASEPSALLETNNSLGASDTIIAIYDGSCGSLVELACSEDEGVGLLSELCVSGLTVGNTYYIQAATFSQASAGEIRLDLTCPCPAAPTNDNCADAEGLDLPASVVFSNEFATDDQLVPCDTSIPTQNVWYSVMGTGNTITASTCNAGTEVGDTIINVFCGDCLEPVCVVGVDDACDDFGFLLSTASWGSQNGVEYLISVGNFPGGQGGRITLDVSDDGVPADVEVNCLPIGACCLEDGTCVTLTALDCADAGGTYSGDDTACDNNSVGDPSFESGSPNASWTEFSATFGTPLCTTALCGFGGGTGPRTGDWWVWFGGVFAEETATMEQDVTIPLSAETLDFYLEIPVSSGNGVDNMTVSIDGNVVFTTTEADGPFAGYELRSIDVQTYADGGTHTILFASTITGEDGMGGAALTNFFVDDVSINTVNIECRDCFTLDFDTQDDFVTPLGNGEAIISPPDFGNVVFINGIGGDTYGTATFDSNPTGPNQFSSDPDLLVNQGNILILQENGHQTVPGFYTTPDDAQLGGLMEFNFVGSVELQSLDLIDICPGPPVPQDVSIVLIDGSGNTRTYYVPGGWTNDRAADGFGGVGTLNLQTLTDQPGDTATATAFEDDGFDRHDVVRMLGFFSSSGGMDNVSFCQE